MNLQEASQDYLHYIQTVDQKSLATIHSYTQDLQEYLSWSQIQGKTETENILPRDIQSFSSDMKQGDIQEDGLCYKHGSVSHILSSIHMSHRFISINHPPILDPSIHLRGRGKEQKLPLYFSPHDIELLLDSFEQDAQGPHQKAILELPCGCGLRVSEVYELHINQVHLEQDYLRVIEEGGKERMVPMYERCMRVLRTYLARTRPTWEKRKSTHVFLNSRGDALTRQYAHMLIKQRLQIPGLDERLSTHNFRHSFATHLSNGGAGLRAMQELLRHSDIAITQIYTHVQNRRLKEAIDQYHPHSVKKEK